MCDILSNIDISENNKRFAIDKIVYIPYKKVTINFDIY